MSDLRDTISAAWDRLTRKPVRPSVEDDAARAKAGAQAIAKPLPEVVMPHKGLEEDRRRKAMIDALLKD